MHTSKDCRRNILLGLALGLVVLALYAPTLGHGFVDFDDPLYVTENAMLQRGLTADTVRWAFTSNHAYNWHPVTWLSLMLDFELFRLNPAGYHATNLFLHALNSMLLFLVLARMTRRRWPSALTAALFALHPLHVESVAWVSERKDVLSTAWMLLTVWGYVRYVERPGPARCLAVGALYAVGLMAKPMLVSLPLVLLLLDAWPLRRIGAGAAREAAGIRRRLGPAIARVALEKAPLAILAAVSCVVTFHVQNTTGAVGSFTQYPLGIRVANALLATTTYLAHMVWPLRLACMYPYQLDLPAWKVLGAAAGMIAVTVVSASLWRRAPYLLVGWLWYLITLVPVIGLVQVGNQAMADRYTYIPLIGVFLMIAWGLADGVRRAACKGPLRSGLRAVASVASVLVLAWLGRATWRQVATWKDTVTVFEHAIEVTERNFLAHNNLANALPGRGRLDDAIYHYFRALQIKPDYAEAHNNLGVALAHRGSLEEAVFHYREALRLRPDCAETYVNLGTVLFNQGRLDEAIGLFAQAVRMQPFLANAHYNLGIALGQRGRLAEAVHHFVMALEIRPDMPDGYVNLIRTLAACGEYGKALIAFEAAVRLYRAWPPALNASLWLLAVERNVEADVRASLIRLAEQAGRPDRSQDPFFLDALGAAYAGAGRFPEAMDAARRAVALLGAANRMDLVDLVGQRLSRYEAQQPYFEEAPTNAMLPAAP